MIVDCSSSCAPSSSASSARRQAVASQPAGSAPHVEVFWHASDTSMPSSAGKM